MNQFKTTFYFATNISSPLLEDGLEPLKKMAIELFGGYTLLNTKGGWRSPKNVDVEEDAYMLIAISDEKLKKEDLFAVCNFIKNEYAQDEVYVTEENVNLIII